MTLAMPLTCPYSGSGSQAGAVPMAGPGSLVPCCRAMRRRRLLPRPITAWTAAGLAADIRREQAALLPARGLIPEHAPVHREQDRKSTRLNSSHSSISYAVFCLKKKKNTYFNNCNKNIKQYQATQ